MAASVKGIVGVTLLVIAALIALLLNYVGAFKPVDLGTGEFGPQKIVFKHHVGAYHKIVPVIQEVEEWARKNGESCRFSFGEYIDNPETVEEGRLQSNGGCVVEKDWLPEKLANDFQFREIPRRNYLWARFAGGPSIAPFKVYPKAKKFAAENQLTLDGAVLELYEIAPDQSVHTLYLFPAIARSGDRQ